MCIFSHQKVGSMQYRWTHLAMTLPYRLAITLITLLRIPEHSNKAQNRSNVNKTNPKNGTLWFLNQVMLRVHWRTYYATLVGRGSCIACFWWFKLVNRCISRVWTQGASKQDAGSRNRDAGACCPAMPATCRINNYRPYGEIAPNMNFRLKLLHLLVIFTPLCRSTCNCNTFSSATTFLFLLTFSYNVWLKIMGIIRSNLDCLPALFWFRYCTKVERVPNLNKSFDFCWTRASQT